MATWAHLEREAPEIAASVIEESPKRRDLDANGYFASLDRALWTTWDSFQKPGMRPVHRVWHP